MHTVVRTINNKPYAVTVLSVQEIKEKKVFALPWTGLIEFTTEIATAFLELNTNNRNISDSVVDKYATVMKEGHWLPEIATPITVSEFGVLQNGQHRLYAVLEADVPVIMNAAFGSSEAALLYFDQGRARTVPDNAGLMGVVQPKVVTASANIVYGLVTGLENISRAAPDIVRFNDENTKAIEWISARIGNKNGKMNRAYITGPLVFAYRANPDKVDEFAKGFVTGEDLPKGSPIAAVRQMFFTSGSRGTARTRYELSAKTLCAIHAYILGKDVHKLYINQAAVPYFLRAHPQDGIIWTWHRRAADPLLVAGAVMVAKKAEAK